MRKTLNLALAVGLVASAFTSVAAAPAGGKEADPVGAPLFTDPAGDANFVNAQLATLANSPQPGTVNYSDSADLLGVALGSDAKSVTVAFHVSGAPGSDNVLYQFVGDTPDDDSVYFRIYWEGGQASRLVVRVLNAAYTQDIPITDKSFFLDEENNVIGMTVNFKDLDAEVAAVLKPGAVLATPVISTSVPNPGLASLPKYDDQYAPDASYKV